MFSLVYLLLSKQQDHSNEVSNLQLRLEMLERVKTLTTSILSFIDAVIAQVRMIQANRRSAAEHADALTLQGVSTYGWSDEYLSSMSLLPYCFVGVMAIVVGCSHS